MVCTDVCHLKVVRESQAQVRTNQILHLSGDVTKNSQNIDVGCVTGGNVGPNSSTIKQEDDLTEKLRELDDRIRGGGSSLLYQQSNVGFFLECSVRDEDCGAIMCNNERGSKWIERWRVIRGSNDVGPRFVPRGEIERKRVWLTICDAVEPSGAIHMTPGIYHIVDDG